jgi:hypothetical protein
MLIGYARISTDDQHLDLQRFAFRPSTPTIAGNSICRHQT